MKHFFGANLVILGLLWVNVFQFQLPSEAAAADTNQANLDKIFKYIDTNEEKWIKNLAEAVAIPTVSCRLDLVTNCVQMNSWTTSKLEQLGFKVDTKALGSHKLQGETIQLPPLLLGTLGSNPAKKTLLIYGHLDVQPAKVSDGWDTDPFNLTVTNGNLYGRGTSDDKGPILAWLAAVEAIVKSDVEIPVNLKAIFECMEECGSPGLQKGLDELKETFLKDVNAVTISDNPWLGTEMPCLTYGLRGAVYFFVEVTGGTKDLHSGSFGGAVREALQDVIWLLSQLTDAKGFITIPGVMDDVIVPTDKEFEAYNKLDFDLEKFRNEAAVNKLRFETKRQTLHSIWSNTSLTLHGIEGAFSDVGSKTVIPRKVIGKFSLRLVSNQNPNKVGQAVKAYLEKIWTQRESPNSLVVSWVHEIKPWMSDYNHVNYKSASKAMEIVYKKTPQLTREGGSIPLVNMVQEATKKNVLLLPLGQSDDGAHSQNEKMSKRNYIQGAKVLAAYLLELGKVSGDL